MNDPYMPARIWAWRYHPDNIRNGSAEGAWDTREGERTASDVEFIRADIVGNLEELQAQLQEAAMKPDWEAFGRAVMEAWPDSGLDGFDVQELAEKHGLIVEAPGGFDPKVHLDPLGICEPRDTFFLRTYK